MSINYDPDGKPELSVKMINLARDHQMHIVNVICDEEGAQMGDQTGVSFLAITPFLPRPGDRIELEDGRACQTRRAFFRLTRLNDEIALVPNVYATLLDS